MKKKFLFALFILVQITATAQATYTTKKTAVGKTRERYDKGMARTQTSEWLKAAKFFDESLRADSTFIDAWLQWAGVQYELNDYAKAERGFLRAAAIDSNYMPRVFYTLGIIAWKKDRFAAAAGYFQRFLNFDKQADELRTKAQRYLLDSRFSAEAVKNPVLFVRKSLGAQVNTKNLEFLPSFTADDSTLIFTRRIRGDEDMWSSKKIGTEWQEATPLDGVNTEGSNEGGQTISADGKLLVFTACNRPDGLGSCDLYFSENKNGEWSLPKNMGAPVNETDWESQPSLAADGSAVYFCSIRKSRFTIGGSDIWVSYRLPDGKWDVPINLGDSINTKGDDQSPFIHPDGKTLYFRSNGRAGMGGFDLFMSRRGADGKWASPTNLGFPINTKSDEGGLVVSRDGKTAYFATDQKDSTSTGGDGNLDLYSFELAVPLRPQAVTYVKAWLRDSENDQLLKGAKYEFADFQTGKVLTSAVSTDGGFLICLPAGAEYSLTISKEKYAFRSEHFNLAADGASIDKPFLMNLELTPLSALQPSLPSPTSRPTEAAKPIVLRNVLFETGSARLLAASQAELYRLKTMLTDNSKLKIQIGGHTDDVGNEAANQLLSEQRAKAVYDFLVQNNISAARLQYKGFGKTQPIETNETPDGRQSNRRTEFIILEK